MSRWKQDSRLTTLAKLIGWEGEIVELVDLIKTILPLIPEEQREPARQYYIDNVGVERKKDGALPIHFYQRLYEFRAILKFLGNFGDEGYNFVKEKAQAYGR